MIYRCHSHYSLRYGTLSVEQLVAEAVRLGLPHLALADINTSAAHWDFWKACTDAGIRPLLGIDFRRDHQPLYVGLARNLAGVQELNAFLSHHKLTSEPIPRRALEFTHCTILYPPTSAPDHLYPWERVAYSAAEANRLIRSKWRGQPEQIIAWQLVTLGHGQRQAKLHRLLRAIDRNVLVTQVDPADCAAAHNVFRPLPEVLQAFELNPHLVQNAHRLADTCDVSSYSPTTKKNKLSFTESIAQDRTLIRKLAEDGLERHYGKRHKAARQRLEEELGAIDRLGFNAYFLITWDITRYARGMGFYHVGRGSGANSLVARCIGISDVCPLELNLPFARFINETRATPPDFDIDFSWDERDKVFEYIFTRYGTAHTALVGAYGTFGFNSSLREVGKALGMPKAEQDRYADEPDQLLTTDDPKAKPLIACAQLMDGMPNILSVHACGVLITEQPLAAHTAVYLPPKGFPTTMIDMYIAEDNGLDKYDILSQRGIGHIKTAVQLVERNKGIRVDAYDFQRFRHDPVLLKWLREAKTIGCFYIESPAMRQLLTKLKCDNWLRLVAASSIIRPGVSSSGMMQEYIRRFHDPSRIEYLHPVFKEQLEETFGVMVYQEDVMKIAMHFAGLSGDDADLLRRAMSGKMRGRGNAFERLQGDFYAGARARGNDDALIDEVWRQLSSFAGYSFCKAHSASLAVESMFSLFLRVHYPLEFYTSVINNFGGFYRTDVYVHLLRKEGATIEPPCVNHSEALTTLTGTTAWLGLGLIHSLRQETIARILAEREENGHFLGLDDFLHRVPIRYDQVAALIKVRAFRFTGQLKPKLLLNALMKCQAAPAPAASLFGTPEQTELDLPAPLCDALEDARDELEYLGLTTGHPFDLAPPDPPGCIRAADLMAHLGQKVRIVGYYVDRKGTRTKHGEVMAFGCFLDRDTVFFDTVHFPKVYQQYRFLGRGYYLLEGEVTEEFGVPNITVSRMLWLYSTLFPKTG